MKNVVTLLLIISSFLAPAQVSPIIGNYKGEISTDSVSIAVTFTLLKDSTYKINMTYHFKEYCVGKDKGSEAFEGSWKMKEDWLFLYPYNKGIIIFYQYQQLSKKDKKLIATNTKDGTIALKMAFEKDKCPRINFQINAECFKDVWKYHYIEKEICN